MQRFIEADALSKANRGAKMCHIGEGVTVGQLIERLEQFPKDIKVTVDSDSVDLYLFRVHNVGFDAESERYPQIVSLYGNPVEEESQDWEPMGEVSGGVR